MEESKTDSMGWLQNHMETFVKPTLGYIPVLDNNYRRVFTSEEMAVVKAMWKAVKCEARRVGKPILLAGRDVFIFEILARREGFPTTFRPDISRLTVSHVKEDYSGHLLFDTGFAGSIPRALRSTSYVMGSASGVELQTAAPIFHPSYTGIHIRSLGRSQHVLLHNETHQVFPRMKGARSLILKIERTPKYWKRGYYRTACKCSIPSESPYYVNKCWRCEGTINYTGPEGIMQDQSLTEEFLAAALLTIEIYKDSSPAFVDKPVNVESRSHLVTYGD